MLCSLYPSAIQYINEYIISLDLMETRMIPYPVYLDIIGQSEIVVDMYRVAADEGFSYRISEALLLERKIITNRRLVLESDFYDPSRIFVIGYDSLERLGEFVQNRFKPLPSEIRKRYDCRSWWPEQSF